MIVVNSNDWFKFVAEGVNTNTISENSKIKNDSLFDSLLNGFKRKWKKMNFCHENASGKIGSISKRWTIIMNWKIETNFFELFCSFSIIANIFEMFVKMFFLISTDFITFDFFIINFCFDIFQEKSILKNNVEKKSDEFFIEVWKKTILKTALTCFLRKKCYSNQWSFWMQTNFERRKCF